ncbi:MAG: rRNA adenine N-6-methyltransferase family protein, partial [Tetragenococcus koreensis]|nr:rRNA adenine N-6-methyltransferase family protein [Tetragenococcus koreensis]
IKRIETKISRKDWKLYENFVRKWVNKEYYSLFTKNQFNKAMKHAKVTSLESLTAEQIISIFNSYKLFRN